MRKAPDPIKFLNWSALYLDIFMKYFDVGRRTYLDMHCWLACLLYINSDY
jgi:hypothetical protein